MTNSKPESIICQTQENETLGRFETTGNEQATFTFARMNTTEVEEMLDIDQEIYSSKIEDILKDAELSKFASKRLKLEWLANTRPDIGFEPFTNCTSNSFHA